MMVPHEISMILSSDPKNGASNITPDGHYFEVQLQDALEIPRDALSTTVSLEEATVWWVSPNVDATNNLFKVDGPDVSDVLTTFNIVIPTGLYDLSGLQQALLRELETAGAKVDPSPLINLTPDEPTQTVEIRFNYDTVAIDFSIANTIRDVLGFDSAVVGPFVGAPVTILGDSVANFNKINHFLIHSDLTTRGIRVNNTYNQTLGQVLIDVPPGSQIVSKPFNPPRIDTNDLRGSKRTNIRTWITNEENQPIETLGEYWSARIVIRYFMPLMIK